MRLQTQENKTAQIVLDLLDTRNMTQSALADEIGLTRQALSSKINGTRSFTKKDYVALADFFDTSVDYLMGRTLDPWPVDNPTPPTGRGGGMKVKDRYWEVENSIRFANPEKATRPLLCGPKVSEDGVKAVQSFLNEHDAGYIAEVTPEQPIIVEALGNKACVYVTKIVQCELRDVLRLLEAK